MTGDQQPAVTHISVRPLLGLAAAILLSLAGCAAPGAPEPPRPRIPEVPTELTAEQLGERVLLTWMPPALETSGARLEQPPDYQVYRGFFSDEASAEREFSQAAVSVLTIPANLADTFLEAGRMRVLDPLSSETISRHAGELAVYAVKDSNRKGQSAGFSKRASVRIYPASAPPRGLRAEVAEDAIQLAWEAPRLSTAVAPIASIPGYRIYRSLTEEKGSFVRVGNSAETSFRDTDFEFGKTYYYFVRALAQYGADVVESAESETLRVTPQDRFPPRPPTGLIAVAVPGSIELSWNPSPERDLAGYHVYRREEPSQPFRRITQQLAKTPTFRDPSVERGKRYRYAVTAVDTSGNESERSAEVSEDAE